MLLHNPSVSIKINDKSLDIFRGLPQIHMPFVPLKLNFKLIYNF